jgi:hypothetical protein
MSSVQIQSTAHEKWPLAWTIDVQPPDQSDLHEIDIDAVDGKVLAVRTEITEEEALDVAVEEDNLAPCRP